MALLLFSFLTILAVLNLVLTPPTSALPKRSNKPEISLTIYNNCQQAFTPRFSSAPSPSFQAREIGPKDSHVFTFDSQSLWKGQIWAPLPGRASGATTRAEIDFDSGDYDIVLDKGFNVAVYLEHQGKKYENSCNAAVCSDANCSDAYRKESGLLQGTRQGDSTQAPNHACPADFLTWVVSFC